jgi:hypothetical protein
VVHVSIDDIVAFFYSDETRKIIENTWTVPIGMIVLYFYGRSHFNTPQYSLELSIGSPIRLLTQTPPIFTTRRARYNSYANRYVLVLEVAFLLFLFAHSVIDDVAAVGEIKLPNFADEPMHHRVVLALFVLTGLLSSFPVIKQVDAWLLDNLHRRAYIPDAAKDLAEKLRDCEFSAPPSVKKAVQASLNMRDTIRVADGKATGMLEKRVFDILCLRSQLQTGTQGDQFKEFRIALEKDLKSLADQSQNLRSAVTSYLKSQERVVPGNVKDIDAYFVDNSDGEGVSEAAERRQELLARCDVLYETTCLTIALSLFATQFSPEDINSEIKEMGFSAEVDRLPFADWNAVGLVSASAFVLTLAFNGLYTVVGYLSGVFEKYPPLVPDKASIIRFAVLYTVAYAIVMWLCIQLKRKWHRDSESRPEELLLAIFSYLSTVWLNVGIGLILRHGQLTYAPFLYALNQAVLGYFIGLYIDRSMKTVDVSITLAVVQATTQAIVAVIATTLSPSLVSSTVAVLDLQIAVFASVQAWVSGFTISILFQRLYRRIKLPAPEPLLLTQPT